MSILENEPSGQRDGAASWGQRISWGAAVFALTGAYAASFLVFQDPGVFRRAALTGGAAAGLAWAAFGLALLATRKLHKVPVLAWADICLQTMLVGNAIMIVGAMANPALLGAMNGGRFGQGAALWHVAVLAASDVAMAMAFVRLAKREGAGVRLALGLYLGLLNGLFLALLGAFWAMGWLA